ncbi:bifunctional 3-(3-hydroxy-phenyl)propionate/3-hydroxycinnamic acid hydroxylase [Cupriavidus necator]
MTHSPSLATAVLVVGAGPTGLTLANILGQQGIDTILIDRKASTVAEPRAVSIDDESLRTMQAIGLVDAVLQDVVPGYGVHYLTRPGGHCFAKVEPTASEYGFPRRNAFRQPLFEATLRDGLKRHPSVRVLFGHTLESLSQDDDGARAIVQCADGQVQINAAYVVGTDGGRSFVRQSIGATLVGSSFNARWLVVDTESDDDTFWQTRAYCDPARPTVEVPGPHQTRRFEFLLKPSETDEEILRPERIAELLRPFRADRPAHIVRKTVYTFHARVADRWRVGRIFLAGDAAHLTPPYAGQGMNSGVRDAHNLGWKLAAVLHNKLAPAALESYEAERRDHAWALIRLALNLGIVMAPRSRLAAWAFSTFFRATALMPPVRDYFLQMKFKPKPRFHNGLLEMSETDTVGLVGTMLPQPSVRTVEGKLLPLDEVTGHGFAHIAIGAEALVDTTGLARALWRRLETRRVVLLPALAPETVRLATERGYVPVELAPAAMPQALRGLAGKVVVVRPDRYVAGVFAHHDADALSTAFGRRIGIDMSNASAANEAVANGRAALTR